VEGAVKFGAGLADLALFIGVAENEVRGPGIKHRHKLFAPDIAAMQYRFRLELLKSLHDQLRVRQMTMRIAKNSN
jgi:hypothetical protein